MRNVILCGFMGCGKTTVGRELAARTGMTFVDMDVYIEEQAGMTVSDLFAHYGEEEFRRREREACRELAARTNQVIAAGGGALTFPVNAEALRQSGVIVLLEISPQAVLARLEGDTTRPLLQRPDKAEAVRQLLNDRLPLYQKAADCRVNAEQEPAAVAGDIVLAIKQLVDNK